jgi:hypothetical protein
MTAAHRRGRAVGSVEFDSLLDRIQERVRARRASGEYPIGLEAQLEAEFDAILRAVTRPEVDTAALADRVSAVGQHAHAVASSPPMDSRLPGGSLVHAAAARVVQRHTNQLVDGVRALGASVHDALAEVVRVLDAQRDADQRQLKEVVGAVFDRLATLDHLVEAVAELEARLNEVEQRAAGE